ncbi:ubiquitination network signaling protein [Botrytis cinerea]
MPRPLSNSKRQQGAANVRDTRHDNGLVGPGKRVPRQKSNGHMNGHANSSDSIPSTPPPSTPPPANGHAKLPGNDDNTSEHKLGETTSRFRSMAFREDCPTRFLDDHPITVRHFDIRPPSTTATSGISFIDMFEGTTGTPSLATIMVVDVLFLLTWVFLYGPLQEFILQFAQSVIALTLGGGLSGKEAGMRNVVLCFGYIGVSHYASISNIKSVGLRTLLSSPRNFLGSFDLDDPLESIPIPIPNWKDRIPIWFEIFLRSQKRDHAASTLGDPEAAKGSADGANDSSTTNPQTPDNEASNSLHASHTAITTRKKRKQSAQVRIQQPLWAALASTKIVMVKEYETSHAAAESAGTNATDASNLGNAPFSTEPDRIWITNVGSDAVLFSTSYFPKFTIPDENQDDTEGSIVNSRMPIFVRVNQAHWQPTRMEASINPSLPAGKNTCWDGEIFGLAPSSSYEIEFFNVVNNKVIFCTSVKTLNTPSDTAAATSLSPLPPQVSGRPGSPSSTIQQSIRASKTKLEEERSRQKRERKDQRTKIQTLRREIDKLSHIIATSGGNDEKQRQKIQQATLQIRQADEAITSIQADIEIADRLPSASKDSEYISAKQKYRTQKELYEKAKSDFTTKKKENEKPITALSAELLNKERQSEKLEARSIKLTHQADDLREANTKGLNEVQRREKQRKDKDDERRMVQANWDKYNVEAQMQLQRYTDDLTMLYPYIDQYTMALQQQHQQEANQLYVNSSWTTAGESSMSAFPAYAPISNMTMGMPQMGGSMTMSQTTRQRGRSSSMLSNESGFTQGPDSDEEHTPFYGPHLQSQSQPQYSPYNTNQSPSPFAPAFRNTSTSISQFQQNESLNWPPTRKGSGSGDVDASGSRSGSERDSIGDPKSPLNEKSQLPFPIGAGPGFGIGSAGSRGLRGVWDN